MNYFAQFDQIRIREKDRLLSYCRDAEETVIICPNNACTCCRQALELLCKSLLKGKHISFDPKLELYKLIEMCVNHGLLSAEATATQLRKVSNRIVHPENDANINQAIALLRLLYKVMADAFHVEVVPFDEKLLNIGFYQVVRLIDKSFYEQRESALGRYNYIAKDEQGCYYYIKGYMKNNKNRPLTQQNRKTNAIIRQSRLRTGYLTPTNVISTSVKSDREFYAYSIFPDSFVLYERKKPFSISQSIDIVLDVISAVEEMKKLNLNYRNINPYSVILTPFESTYQAMLINMESVRNAAVNETVYVEVKQFYKENAFIPAEIRNIDTKEYDSNKIPWEQVSTYSCAVLFLVCAFPSLVHKDVIDTNELVEELPEEISDLTEFLCNTFDSSLAMVGTLEEFRDVLEIVKAGLE